MVGIRWTFLLGPGLFSGAFAVSFREEGFQIIQSNSTLDVLPVMFEIRNNLVGGFNPSQKYYSKWESSPNRGENKKCLKPPPSNSTRLELHDFRELSVKRFLSWCTNWKSWGQVASLFFPDIWYHVQSSPLGVCFISRMHRHVCSLYNKEYSINFVSCNSTPVGVDIGTTESLAICIKWLLHKSKQYNSKVCLLLTPYSTGHLKSVQQKIPPSKNKSHHPFLLSPGWFPWSWCLSPTHPHRSCHVHAQQIPSLWSHHRHPCQNQPFQVFGGIKFQDGFYWNGGTPENMDHFQVPC